MNIHGTLSRAVILILLLGLLVACGGGHSSGKTTARDADAPSGDTPTDAVTEPDPADDSNTQNPPQDSPPRQPVEPVLNVIITDQGPVGAGRITDSTIAFAGVAGAGDVVRLYLNSQLAGSVVVRQDGSWMLDYSSISIAPGAYSIALVAQMEDGSEIRSTQPFLFEFVPVVLTAPVIAAISPDTGLSTSDGITRNPSLQIFGTADANATVLLQIEGSAAGSVIAASDGSWVFDNAAMTLSDGNYAIRAQQMDAAGNLSPLSAAFSLVVDTVAPSAVTGLIITPDTGTAGDGVTAANRLTIAGNAEASAQVQLRVNGAVLGQVRADAGGAWLYDYSATVLADGTYTLSATQSDVAGNESAPSTGFTLTVLAAAPLVTLSIPADNSSAAGLADDLVIVFDSPVFALNGAIGIYNAANDSLFESIPVNDVRVSGAGTTRVVINPSLNLVGESQYFVLIDGTAFANSAGIAFAGMPDSSRWNFTAEPTAVVNSVPAINATDVALNASFSLSFNETVYLGAGNVRILKASDNSVVDTIAIDATQVSGAGTSTIVIDQTDVLEPDTGYYLQLDAGALVNANNVGFAGLASNSFGFTTANVSQPTVVNVISTSADGVYTVGDSINVQVEFSEPVILSAGVPLLMLDMNGIDRQVAYQSGSGTAIFEFNYAVVLGDATPDLDYVDSASFNLNGATMRSASFANADVTLPVPGEAGSLGANRDITIDANKITVANLASGDGFRVQGSVAGAHLGWSVAALGDVNGDGFEDFATGAPDQNGAAGAIYVLYGAAGATRNNLGSAAISNGANGFAIRGQSVAARFGAAAGGAGDINDDGFDDIFVVAPLDDGVSTDAGIVYVIYGKANQSDINLGSFNSSVGFRITTSEPDARIADSFSDFVGNGQAIDAGGDFNGDGVSDLAIGLRYSDTAGVNSGKAYILFGQKRASRGDLNLDLISDTGPDGMLITGAGAGWQLGQSVRFVGDYDADGYDDVLVGAIFSDAIASAAGESYLIFGAPGPLFYPVDVGSLNGAGGFRIFTGESGGLLGHAAGSGDFNGDGISDLMLSSHGKSSAGKSANGAAFVLYGDAGGSYGNIDIDVLSSDSGYAVYGEADTDSMGHSLAGAGDFNADGIDDLLLGSYLNAEAGNSAGAAWMVMGQGGSNRSDLDLAALTNVDGFKIAGAVSADHFAQATDHVDANGDGYSDLIMGAPLMSTATAAGGETVLIWGRDFSRSVTPGLLGDSNANNLVGTAGNDVIVSGGGADAISAGAGDDLIQLSDTGFYNIEGGTGLDTLQFVTGQNDLNIAGFGPEVINGIEVIDLGNSGNALQVSKAGVQAMSRQSRALYVIGGSSDRVASTPGDAWCFTGTRVIAGTLYKVFLDNGAILYVQSSIDTDAVNSFNSTQTYRFNTTASGANVADAVTDFPVLIRISDSAILNAVQNGAADIRFTDGDQVTWLPYEIERWTSTAAEVWVKVPQVDGNSSADSIVLHYNDKINASVPDRQNPAQLWAQYSAVYHFNDTVLTRATDATAYQNNASGTRASITSNALIGAARGFSGGEYSTPDRISLDVSGDSYSLEFWYNEPSGFLLTSRKPIVSRGSGSKQWRFESGALILLITNPPRVQIDDGVSGTTTLNFGGSGLALLFSFGSWNYMNLVMDSAGGMQTAYLNGIAVDTDASFRDIEDPAGNQNLVIGGAGSSMALDEFRVYRGVLSADRIRLNYANQRIDSNFVIP